MQASEAEAGRDREHALKQLHDVSASRAALAAQVELLTQELQNAQASLQHYQVTHSYIESGEL